MDSVNRLTTLLKIHLGDSDESRKWCISTSTLGGRGVFAAQDIGPNEVIYTEKPLIIGPTGGADTKVNVCTVCFKCLDIESCLCDKGCSLPVCADCGVKHVRECELLRSWEPKEPNKINKNVIRGITMVRGLLLDEDMKSLVNSMQANKSAAYKMEIKNLAACFQQFPEDDETLDFLLKVVEVLNTNAFEAFNPNESNETALRALYPLAGTMNHQCTPNTCHTFDDSTNMVCKAVKFIPKGAEIYTSYTKILWSNMTRFLFLNMTKHFTCTCPRCSDPTENGTFISALKCRAKDCTGMVLPTESFSITSPWKCLDCSTIYEPAKMMKIQDFILALLQSKSNSSTPSDLIEFIAEKVPRICSPSNQFVLEAKVQLIWKMAKGNTKYPVKEIQTAIQYCNDILNVLDKLGAGECTLKSLVEAEIEKFHATIDNINGDEGGILS